MAAAIALAGCNIAASNEALFAPGGAGAPPSLAPGLWALARPCLPQGPQLRCGPGVADYLVMTKTALWQVDPPPGAVVPKIPPALSRLPVQKIPRLDYLMVAGSPIIVQLHATVSAVQAASGSKGPWPKTVGGENRYAFLGLEPIARNRQGEITAARFWLVKCGPDITPDEMRALPRGKHVFTMHPLPEMRIIADGAACIAPNRAAILKAAAPSRGWAGLGPAVIRWVGPGPAAGR